MADKVINTKTLDYNNDKMKSWATAADSNILDEAKKYAEEYADSAIEAAIASAIAASY